MIDLDAALGQQFLQVAVRQAVAEVPAHSQQDHLGREPEPSEARGNRHGRSRTAGSLHRATLTTEARSVNATEPFNMPKAFPIEFRNDVVAVARKGEASIARVAKDFGVSESCLQRWLKLDDIEAGKRPGVSRDESAELRELKKRNRLLEQEAEVMRRGSRVPLA